MAKKKGIPPDVKTTAIVASALQELLSSLGPLRVFHGFPEGHHQDLFFKTVWQAQEVLRRLRDGTLGRPSSP